MSLLVSSCLFLLHPWFVSADVLGYGGQLSGALGRAGLREIEVPSGPLDLSIREMGLGVALDTGLGAAARLSYRLVLEGQLSSMTELPAGGFRGRGKSLELSQLLGWRLASHGDSRLFAGPALSLGAGMARDEIDHALFARAGVGPILGLNQALGTSLFLSVTLGYRLAARLVDLNSGQFTFWGVEHGLLLSAALFFRQASAAGRNAR